MPDEPKSCGAQHDSSKSPPLWLLALATLGGSLSMHIFVPALPAVAASLHASNFLVQMTLTTYVLGLGAGQLLHGPLSDRFGRRPILIAGMVIYVAASLVALVAPSVDVLIAARLFQALGAGAGVVLGRAIVRDSFNGNQAASMLSLLNLMVMIAPGIAPLVGASLAGLAGWRAIFAVLAALGLFNLFTTTVLLPETATGPQRGFSDVITGYGHLLGSRSFIGWAIAGGCASASLYGFIGASPFIFVHQLHRSPSDVGLYLALNIAGMAIGTLAARSLISRFPVTRIVAVGIALSAAGSAVFVGFAWSGGSSLASVLSTMFIFTIGAGLLAPMAMAQALAVYPRAAGSSSGLYGCTQMAIGAICTLLVGIGTSPMLSAGIIMLGGVVLSQACIRMAAGSKAAFGSPGQTSEAPQATFTAPKNF